MELFDLQGKVAVVTGGNGGIGLGMAQGLAEAGAAIMVAGRDTGKNEQAVASLKDIGVDADSFVLDVTDDAACRALMTAAVDRFGRLDILVNNAGINIRKRPEDLTGDDWRQVLETNLTSAFSCSQAAYPHMKAAGGGKIICIGSMYSLFGGTVVAAYAASKGGVVQLTKSLAVAWADDNIQVNAILPGWIDTELTKRARIEVPDLNDRVHSRTPAGRWGTPEDHRGAAIFLASAASDYVTGASIPVDGGYAVF